jgi:hypothetical protein
MLTCRDTAAVTRAASVAAATPILSMTMPTTSEGEAEPAVAMAMRDAGSEEDVYAA